MKRMTTHLGCISGARPGGARVHPARAALVVFIMLCLFVPPPAQPQKGPLRSTCQQGQATPEFIQSCNFKSSYELDTRTYAGYSSPGGLTLPPRSFYAYVQKYTGQFVPSMFLSDYPGSPYTAWWKKNGVPPFACEVFFYLEEAWGVYDRLNLWGVRPRWPQAVQTRPVRTMPLPANSGRINVVFSAFSDNLLTPRHPPAQFRHGVDQIAINLKPVKKMTLQLMRHYTAHELFHFVQSYMVTPEKCTSADGLWWIDATAEYVSCDLVWVPPWDDLSYQKGGGDKGQCRTYPYLLDYPLTFNESPTDDHQMPDFAKDEWDKGEELSYDKGFFIQFLVKDWGADFVKMNKEVLDYYRAHVGSDAVLTGLNAYFLKRGTGLGLAEAYRSFAAFYMLSGTSPLAKVKVKRLAGGTAVSTTPLDCVIKPPHGQEREAEIIPAGPIVTPIEQEFKLPGGYSAKMLAVELGPQPTGGPQPPRRLQIEAPRMDYSGAQVFVGPKRKWFNAHSPVPVAEIKKIGSPVSITLGDGATLYILVSGNDPKQDGEALIRISDGPSLSLLPLAVKGLKAIPQNFKATLRSYFGTGLVNFMWKQLAQARPQKFIQGEAKSIARPSDPIETAQAITFPEPGRYEVTCSAYDSSGVLIAESKPVACEIADSPPSGPKPSPAADPGHWRLVEIKTEKYVPAPATPPAETLEAVFSVSEGFISGKLTGDGHLGEGPGTWAGQCSWSWNAPNGLNRLIPGEIIEARMTVTDQSVPEKVSGWQHGYAGVGGNIRFDNPNLPWGMVDAAAQDLLNVSVRLQQSATQDGKLAVPKGPGNPAWGNKLALRVNFTFGRFDRIYEWGTGPDTPVVRPGSPPAPQAQQLGRVWRVHEASSEMSYDGVWTRRGSSNTFDAVWQAAGVTDTITIESVSGDRVVLFRSGNGGRYIGTLSPDRKRVISGTMSWAPTFKWTATIE
jgi:hypothetical protein